MIASETTSMTALVADIGGTWARFALARRPTDGDAAPTLHAESRVRVAEHASLIAAAQHYSIPRCRHRRRPPSPSPAAWTAIPRP